MCSSDLTCLVCHRSNEAELKARVEQIQDITWKLQLRACDLVAKAHNECGEAMAAGATDEQLAPIRAKIRSSQLRSDFVASSNGMGFHAPQEAARILADAVDLAQEARLELAKLKR